MLQATAAARMICGVLLLLGLGPRCEGVGSGIMGRLQALVGRGYELGLKICWSVPGLPLGSGRFQGWSWRKEVELGLALGSEFSRFSRKASPNPSLLGRHLRLLLLGLDALGLLLLVLLGHRLRGLLLLHLRPRSICTRRRRSSVTCGQALPVVKLGCRATARANWVLRLVRRGPNPGWNRLGVRIGLG